MSVKDKVETVESVLKIAAIIVGGWWAWIGFVRNRVQFPKANIEHDLQIWRSRDQVFLHLTVRIVNTGNVLMRVTNGCAWVEQLVPTPAGVSERIALGKDIVESGRVDAEWAMIQRRDLPSNHNLEIEPGETDHIDFDFVIEPNVERILVYSHFPNPKKKTAGWGLNTIHEIPAVT